MLHFGQKAVARSPQSENEGVLRNSNPLLRSAMHSFFQSNSDQQASAAHGTDSLIERLPIGATQLDAHGRILHHMTSQGFDQEPRCVQMAGESFFEKYCHGTPLAHLSEVYQEGVQSGELYHFVDVSVGRGSGARELTLFLYYHAPTAQGWIFVEPHSEEATTLMTRIREAA